MSSYYSNPTANAAMGAVDKEIRQMAKRATRIKALRKTGRLTPEIEARARREFTGIFRPLLERALDPSLDEET